MCAVHHRLALSTPALVSAPSKKKIISNVSSPILACSCFTSTGGGADSPPSNTPGCPFEQQSLPLGDLIGMYIEPLGQFGDRLFPLDRGQRHFGLKGRRMIPARSSLHDFAPFIRGSIMPRLVERIHLAACSDYLGPPLMFAWVVILTTPQNSRGFRILV